MLFARALEPRLDDFQAASSDEFISFFGDLFRNYFVGDLVFPELLLGLVLELIETLVFRGIRFRAWISNDGIAEYYPFAVGGLVGIFPATTNAAQHLLSGFDRIGYQIRELDADTAA